MMRSTMLLLALTGCATANIVDATDAGAPADASTPEDAGPPVSYTPPPDAGTGPDNSPCVKLPAEADAAVGDDCFAYDLSSWCAPYFCGRPTHYFCNGASGMPAQDCVAAGTTQGTIAHGWCCAAPVCVRSTSSDALCSSNAAGKHFFSCPLDAADAGAPAGCARIGQGDKGDPTYCCP